MRKPALPGNLFRQAEALGSKGPIKPDLPTRNEPVGRQFRAAGNKMQRLGKMGERVFRRNFGNAKKALTGMCQSGNIGLVQDGMWTLKSVLVRPSVVE